MYYIIYQIGTKYVSDICLCCRSRTFTYVIRVKWGLIEVFIRNEEGRLILVAIFPPCQGSPRCDGPCLEPWELIRTGTNSTGDKKCNCLQTSTRNWLTTIKIQTSVESTCASLRTHSISILAYWLGNVVHRLYDSLWGRSSPGPWHYISNVNERGGAAVSGGNSSSIQIGRGGQLCDHARPIKTSPLQLSTTIQLLCTVHENLYIITQHLCSTHIGAKGKFIFFKRRFPRV